MGTEPHTVKNSLSGNKKITPSREQSKSSTEDSWLNIIDQRLTEAMEQGDFNNLPGQGKPLDFSQDSLVPDDKRLAYKLLKNNDLTLAWIGKRTNIQSEIKKWRTALSTQFEFSQREWQATNLTDKQMKVQKQWTDYITQQEQKLEALNKKITALNLQQPIASLEIFHLRIDEEFETLGIRNLLDLA